MVFCILFFIFFWPLLYLFLKLDCNPLLAFYEKFFPNKKKLRNKTVWIIGSSSGVGEELAYQLAELNCRLILTSTNESKLQEVKQKCIQRSKNNLKSDDILVLAYDVSNFKENDTAFKRIVDQFGKIDILACNAARIYTSKVTDDDFEEAKKLFDINFFSHFYIAKIVLRHWLEIKSKGQILVTSSVGIYFDYPFLSSYLASKKAMTTFFRDLAQQQQCNGIDVAIVCLGPTDTKIFEKSFEFNGKKTNIDYMPFMSTERSVHLTMIALANKLNESWIALNKLPEPMLLMTYLCVFFNYQIHYFMRTFNLAKLIEKKMAKQ